MKTSAQELFLQANQCYARKEFKDAENLYKKIPQKSAAIWYNMGNCAYKNGKDLEALLYWKRAKKMSNSTIASDCTYNCALVSNKLNISAQSNTKMPFIPALPLQILFFCTFSVFLVINRRLWRAKRFALLVSLGIVVAGCGMITVASYRNSTNTYALIMHDESTMYAGPDAGYHEVCPLPKGTEVVMLTQKNGWAKVAWSGYNGWIKDNKIEII
jgi:tetratricopeptide (TPR) repeat protein